MKFQIKKRWNDSVIFEAEADTLKQAVEKAVEQRANLSNADLSEANLSGANLSEAIMPSPMQPQSLADAAARTRKWLAGRWVQKKWIETPNGAYAGDCKACLHGAAVYIGGPFGPELSRVLCEAGCTVEWNDAKERTESDVLAALDKIAQAT